MDIDMRAERQAPGRTWHEAGVTKVYIKQG